MLRTVKTTMLKAKAKKLMEVRGFLEVGPGVMEWSLGLLRSKSLIRGLKYSNTSQLMQRRSRNTRQFSSILFTPFSKSRRQKQL